MLAVGQQKSGGRFTHRNSSVGPGHSTQGVV